MGDKNNKLYIGNLSSRVKTRDLEVIYEPYGKIDDIKIINRGETYAFIEFNDHRDA
jgi:splicing factor, arginine/serine-rich 7